MAFAVRATAVVVNPIIAFIQPAQVDGAKEDVPGARGEWLEPEGQRREDVGDVHPALIPPNASIGRDAPDLEVLRIRERAEPRHIESIGGGIERRGPTLLQGLVGAHLIEGMAEGIEAPLLGA